MTLVASALTKRYRGRTVLDGVSLSVGPGSIHGLLGPNGSGKTTALHVLVGLVAADVGSVRVCGVDIADKRSRSRLGFAPDDLPLPGALTGREYLVFHDSLRGRDDIARACGLADALGLGGELHRSVGEYSHGMQRKLQLIAAAMHDPELLVLDEPFRGLDPESVVTVRALLRTFARGRRSVLLATHDMLRAERDCDEVTLLSGGERLAVGPPDRLVAASGAATLEEFFLRATGRDAPTARAAERIDSLFGDPSPVGPQ